MEDLPKLDNCCRICAGDHQFLNVFSEEGKQSQLQEKMRKHLKILISVDDKLPKMICFSCYTYLESIDKFVILALQTQEDFATLLNVELKHIIDGPGATEIKSHLKDEEREQENFNASDCNIESDIKIEADADIDPLLFVQCSLDDSGDLQDDPNVCSAAPLSDHNYSILKEEEGCQLSNAIKSFRNENNSDNTKNSSEEHSDTGICAICTRTFLTNAELREHMWMHLSKLYNVLTKSENIKKSDIDPITMPDSTKCARYAPVYIPCPICKKKLSTKDSLKVHLETHGPKGKYKCDLCSRVFRSETNLCNHKENHNVSYNFTCKVCARVYPSRSTLRAHCVSHSNARPHSCIICAKTFKRNQDLKFHINQHTGTRPYRCAYCPKTFASSGNSFSHRKRMHPKEMEMDREKAAALIVR